MPSLQDLSFEIPISSIESIAPNFSRASSDLSISLTAAPAALPSHAAHKKSLLLSFPSDRKRDNFFIFVSNVFPHPVIKRNENETWDLDPTANPFSLYKFAVVQAAAVFDI